MSIRARLFLLIMFATLIPAMVGGLRFLEYRKSQIADAKQALATATRQIAQALSDTVSSTAQLHYGLSRARDLDTKDRAVCSDFLAEVLKAHPQYTGILTIKPDGRLFCDSLRTGRTLDLTDRQYFQNATKSKNPLAVEPVFGRLTGMAVLQIAYGVRNDKGETQFVLLASLDLEKYMRARSQSLPRGDAQLALMDSQGTILTWHPGREEKPGASIAKSPLFQFVRESRKVSVREDIQVDGKSRIWAASMLPEFEDVGLHVLVGVSENDLLAKANAKLYESLATLAAVWLLVFAGAWALAELAIRRQAARIIATVARFSEGDFGARIGIPYPRGELGELMAALDRAFELLRSQRDVIEQLNTDLERKVAERTAQLEVLVQELDSFSHSVAHDLREPMRHITGFSAIVLKTNETRLDEDSVDCLHRITAACERMGLLIDDLLALSRVSRQELNRQDFDLSDLAGHVVGSMVSAHPERKVHVSVKPDMHARGDPSLVRIVLENLIGNAWKFTSRTDEPRIEVGCEERGGETVYFVRDNGAGFDMKYADKLFGAFQRLHTDREFKGTGIGLSIVQRIVARHGGKTWAEAKVGEGATFYFALG